MKGMIEHKSVPNHEKLGMTKEQYDQVLGTLYGNPSDDIRLYNPYLSDDDDEPSVNYDNDEFEEDFITLSSNHKEQKADKEEQLIELLGIEDRNEIDEIQKEIDKNHSKGKSSTGEKETSEDKEPTKDDLDELSNDLESLFENEIPEPKEEPEPVLDEEPMYQPLEEDTEQEDSVKEQTKEPKKTKKGEGEALFNEIFMALNGEQPKEQSEKEPLFSEEVPVEYDTPIILDIEDKIPVTDEDIPYIPEDEYEQEKLINVLNLLDTETNRLEKEVKENPTTDKEEKKKILTQRLSILAEQGEGKDHMKEILATLMELYQLEGKEEEMRAIREEYQEYLNDEDMELRIFEEDIIRVDKKKKDPFELPEKYLWIATNSISDGKEGEQRWIGKCIGKNQNYIHFRDMSQRIWINVGEYIEQIEIGDLLAIFVDRNGESITAKDVLTLKEIPSQHEQKQPVVN